jgi:hypothetical protein
MKTLKSHLNDLVREVGRFSHDPEVAHIKEVALWEFVLRKISEGDFGEATEWAAIALETKKYDFARWCA